MARLLLLDVNNDYVREIECNGLQDYYNALECDCFDIVNRKIGFKGKKFDLFIDDEGLLKNEPIISAVDLLGEPTLVGNIIFANHDHEGNTVDLSDSDIEYIMEYIEKGYTVNRPDGYRILTYCEY